MRTFNLRNLLYGVVIAGLMMSCTGTTPSNKQEDVADTTASTAEEGKKKVLALLADIRTEHVIGGIHNREPNSNPAQWTNEIHKHVGAYPALWSGDFLFQQENIEHRNTMIDEAIKQFNQGAIVNIMWHACNPANGQPCAWDDGEGVLSTLTDEQWEELFTPETAIHTQFVHMMEEIAVHLQRLKESDVIALFRPFHEMNQGKFWWGGRPGENGTAKLYRWIHDYLTNEKQLDNLLWVWNIQDFSTLDADLDAYNPGDAYWDIVSLDVYDDASGFSQEKYESVRRVANGKPMGIGEFQKLPSLKELEEQPDWVFFMGWSELVFEHNTVETIKEIYGSERVLMLPELP